MLPLPHPSHEGRLVSRWPSPLFHSARCSNLGLALAIYVRAIGGVGVVYRQLGGAQKPVIWGWVQGHVDANVANLRRRDLFVHGKFLKR